MSRPARAGTPAVPREPLQRYLDARGIGSGEVEVERIGEGHSNITCRVCRGGTRLVLRRPPPGPLPPSAHDVLREARLLLALEDTAARTPRVLDTCADESVLGAPFYLMEEASGSVITSELPPALDNAEDRRRIGLDLVDALVELHAVGPSTPGLEGFGKPSGYLTRQLRRFGGLWEHNKTREIAMVGEVGEWLAQNMPASPPASVVHGDYRLGNTMVAGDPPGRVVAIFDWELATIGDPLADLGYLTATWVEAGDRDDSVLSSLSALTRREGFPARAELVARYEERSGRSAGGLGWYQALAMWKAAIFMEGNYRRFLAGTSDDSFLERFDEGVPALAERARKLGPGSGPPT